MKPTIKHLIAEGKTKQAIELLLTKVQSSPDAEFQNNITLLSGRFHDLESKKHARTITDDAYNAERGRINQAILHYAEEMPDEKSAEKIVLPQADAKTIIQNADKIYNINHIDNANFS